MTASSPQIGDPKLTTVTVGNIDVLKQAAVITLSIYESIFTPATIADITVADTNNLIGKGRMTGGEPVSIVLDCMIEGSPTIKLDLVLDQIADAVAMGAQKSKLYTLKCVSPEALDAKINYVQKCYENKLCSDMISDIVKTYLHSKKKVDVESTKGPQTILIPNINPYHAISLVRKRSISSSNKSSVYVFYESREGSQTKYKFTTIEQLFKGSVIKSFKQSDAINADIRNVKDDNIISYRVSHQASASELIKNASTSINIDDLRSNYKQTATKKPKPGQTGGSSSVENSYIQDKNKRSKIQPTAQIPTDTNMTNSRIAEFTPDFRTYIGTLMQNSLRIRVIGDTALTAGSMIDCTIPEKQAAPGAVRQEPMLTGKFLISRIHHRIGAITEQPRYSCIIEGLKGQYEGK